jgi:ArsR family transcriptional regulator
MSVQPDVASCCPPDAGPLPALSPEEEVELLASLTRALGHPARVHILRVLLAKKECIAGELAGDLPLAASTVSQHLKILKEVGLIKGEVDGPRRCYCVDMTLLRRFKELVAKL